MTLCRNWNHIDARQKKKKKSSTDFLLKRTNAHLTSSLVHCETISPYHPRAFPSNPHYVNEFITAYILVAKYPFFSYELQNKVESTDGKLYFCLMFSLNLDHIKLRSFYLVTLLPNNLRSLVITVLHL